MSIDDITYVICLLVCIGAGNYIKAIRNENQRKLISTALGILVVFIVSGIQGFHCIISAILGSCGVLMHPKHCHLITFVIMFGYLVFFRLTYLFGLPDPPGHTNMIQMILTLKVAGVAFEKNYAWKKTKQNENLVGENKKDENQKLLNSPQEITAYDQDILKIQIPELCAYYFNYIGVLTGPYYRYRTFRDYFETPFKDYAPAFPATMEKLKNAGLYCLLFLCANYLWPLSYAMSDEFYEERSFLYRLMYVWPTFFIFRMRIYTGLTLSECVCTMAGFGAYPDESEPSNGEGPTKPYMHLKSNADKLSYNFTTIVNIRVKDVETCWTFREGMKHWNICVQYWLAVNVYKLFPSKKYRTAATLLCSAYWHGFRPGHYFCIMGAPFYVPLEDIWNSLVRKNATGQMCTIINCIFWIAKFFAFSYLGTAFLLVSFSNIWKFYSSIYHIGYITWGIMLAIGLILSKQKKRQHKAKD